MRVFIRVPSDAHMHAYGYQKSAFHIILATSLGLLCLVVLCGVVWCCVVLYLKPHLLTRTWGLPIQLDWLTISLALRLQAHATTHSYIFICVHLLCFVFMWEHTHRYGCSRGQERACFGFSGSGLSGSHESVNMGLGTKLWSSSRATNAPNY